MDTGTDYKSRAQADRVWQRLGQTNKYNEFVHSREYIVYVCMFMYVVCGCARTSIHCTVTRLYSSRGRSLQREPSAHATREQDPLNLNYPMRFISHNIAPFLDSAYTSHA